MARFHQDALPRFPWLVFIYVGINDLRMRMYLQHRRCFPLPAIGEKRFIYEKFGGQYCTRFSIDRYHILQTCWYGQGLQTFQIIAKSDDKKVSY